MNRIEHLFQQKTENVLSIYMTAGFPEHNDTVEVIKALEESGADMVEVGIPFSDPLADGPIIQQSSQLSLANGISLKKIFQQLGDVRKDVKIPLVLMGYLNTILQYGFEKFVKDAVDVGIDGMIIPDLPLDIYNKEFRSMVEGAGLSFVMLVTPQTSEQRVVEIAAASGGFLYMVADSATTGSRSSIKSSQQIYFERIAVMNLSIPRLIGFGIYDSETFYEASKYANGAIIGSAFIEALSKTDYPLKKRVENFVSSILQREA